MTKHDMTRFDSSMWKNDSIAVCIASYLDFDPTTIPDFTQFGKLWIDALKLYMRIHGYKIEVEESPRKTSGYCFAWGVDDEGSERMIIMRGKNLFHNPHHERKDIDNLQKYIYIKKR